ncbi:sigma-70 family RNA polymerase sigma factor [Sphingomonas oryzagri]
MQMQRKIEQASAMHTSHSARFADEEALNAQVDFAAALASVQPALRSYARRLTRNEADSEDLVQDTCVRAWRARLQFMPGSNLRAWLFRIASNCFLSGLRRSARFTLGAQMCTRDCWSARRLRTMRCT